MEDLLQSQIKESCKLALPNGLQELMRDISREVLRAQPNDLYKFISDYLSALLVTRENMSVVTRVCQDTCAGSCLPELGDELRYLGLSEGEAATAMEMILEYFNSKVVINEGDLIMKLMKKTDLDIDILPQIQSAVRIAFRRHQANHTVIYESSSESDKNETDRAASHTIQLYRKTNPNDEELNQKAAKVQAAYRAYGVGRCCGKRQKKTHNISKTSEAIRKNITFEPSVKMDEPSVSSSCNNNKTGSYLNLPKHRPYSVHESDNSLSEVREDVEKEQAIDTEEELRKVTDLSGERRASEEYKTENVIDYEIEEKATEADIDSDESIHEFINEEFQNGSQSEGNDLTE